jgi:hypothetical protein
LERRKKYEESAENLPDLPKKRIPENINTELEMMESEKPSVPHSVTYKLEKEK